MLEASLTPKPDELLISGAFDLQRGIMSHVRFLSLDGLKHTSCLSALPARPFQSESQLSAKSGPSIRTAFLFEVNIAHSMTAEADTPAAAVKNGLNVNAAAANTEITG